VIYWARFRLMEPESPPSLISHRENAAPLGGEGRALYRLFAMER